MLKLNITSEEYNALSDSLKEQYKENGDKYTLDVEKDNSKLKEFRDHNVKLLKQVDELTKKLENAPNSEEYNTIKAELDKIKEQKLIDSGEVDKLFEQRTETMKKDYDSQIKGLKDRLNKSDERGDKYEKSFHKMKIVDLMDQAVNDMGVEFFSSSARTDFMDLAERHYHFDSDSESYVPKELNGNLMYGKDAEKTMTPVEFVDKVVEQRSYLFKGSSGGNAGGSGQGGPTVKKVMANDHKSIQDNLKSIADGTMRVVR